MNPRRGPLVGVAPVLLLVLFLGQIGTVELILWLALALLWVVAFATWAARPAQVSRPGRQAH